MKSFVCSLHMPAGLLLWTVSILSLMILAPGSVQAQLQVLGGNITLNITTGQAGLEPLPVTNSLTSLSYKRENVLTKITVSTSCPGQRFNLSVVASSVQSGTAAPKVTLTNGMLATDFIVGIPVRPPGNAQTATLVYEASSTFAQGNSAELGNDTHTVTYTILAQ